MAALAGSVLPVYPHACGRMGLGGVGAWSSEHGIIARMASVKMLRCCDGAAGASGRGAGCDDGVGCSGGKAAGGVHPLLREIIPRIVVVLHQWWGCGAVVLKQAGGAFRGVAVVAGTGLLSSSESGGRGGGALQGAAAAGSGATTSPIACGMNLAVGDPARCRTGGLL